MSVCLLLPNSFDASSVSVSVYLLNIPSVSTCISLFLSFNRSVTQEHAHTRTHVHTSITRVCECDVYVGHDNNNNVLLITVSNDKVLIVFILYTTTRELLTYLTTCETLDTERE